MGTRSCGRILPVLPVLLLFACAFFTVANAQVFPDSPDRSNPSNQGGYSRGDDTIPVSSGMLTPFLPKIPNLELGFLYSFGNSVSTGRFTADYFLPFQLSSDSVLFGEAHAEGQDFWKIPSVSVASPPGFTTTTSAPSSRVDLSFGGGFRTMFGASTLLGVNGFYDTTRLGDTWYPSGGVGLEMAALLDSDAFDLTFNWYGQLFNSNVIVNAFRYGPSNFDFQAGYSHELWEGGPDLRLSATGYKFDIGDSVYGWNAGAQLKSRNGMLVLEYNIGHDRVNETYQTIGGFINVGLQFGNILRGESPFTMPEPIFKSPRSLWYMLSQKVNRNWHQPDAVVLARKIPEVPKRQPVFQFKLVDKGRPYPDLESPFDQSTGVPLTELTFKNDHRFGAAKSYSVAIIDPDHVITTDTVSVTLTPTFGTLQALTVRRNAQTGSLTIAVARDGTPLVVRISYPTDNGCPYAAIRDLYTVRSGTITISGAGVQDLVISVRSRN